MALIGDASGLLSWDLSGDWFWTAGRVAWLANGPFTLPAIMPTNHWLKATSPAHAEASSRALLIPGGQLEDGRGALGQAGMLVFARAPGFA